MPRTADVVCVNCVDAGSSDVFTEAPHTSRLRHGRVTAAATSVAQDAAPAAKVALRVGPEDTVSTGGMSETARRCAGELGRLFAVCVHCGGPWSRCV